MTRVPPTLRSLNSLGLLLIAVLGRGLPGQCTTQWAPSPLPGTNGELRATAMWDPDGAGPEAPRLVVGGAFTIAGNAVANNIAMFDDASGQWQTLGGGTDADVLALLVLPTGDLLAGGLFTTAGGQPASRIARWNGTAWSSFAGGVNYAVNAMALMACCAASEHVDCPAPPASGSMLKTCSAIQRMKRLS